MPEGLSWPRYEDGEPVRMGEPYVAYNGREGEVCSVTIYAPGPDAAWAVNASSCVNFIGGRDEAHAVHGLRLKRPAPKAVGADGVEVKEGDHVWLAPEYRCKAGVTSVEDVFRLWPIGATDMLRVSGVEFDSEAPRATFGLATDDMETFATVWCPASWLTHTAPCLDKDGVPVDKGDTVWMDGSDVEWEVLRAEGGLADLRDSRSGDGYYSDEAGVVCSKLTHELPDSWGRLREDAVESIDGYWGCWEARCSDCPVRVGGKTPKEHYRTNSCGLAMQLDIVARAERLAVVQGE